MSNWLIKPGVILTIGIGLALNILGGGFWLGMLSERVNANERTIERRADAVESVRVVQSQITSMQGTLSRILDNQRWLMQRERKRSGTNGGP